MNLPRFTVDGLLPDGDYPLSLAELRESYLVTGDGVGEPTWDAAWRAQLVDNLELFIRQLWQVGVERIFVNGSFVIGRPHPNDIDAYFECETTRFANIIVGLSQLEPPLPWDWTHRPIDPATGIPKPRMWHRYRVELFPHFVDQPIVTGIRDEYGNELLFPALFRRDRDTSLPKGIIQIIREKPE
jgi:hypothetical protein